MEIVSAGIKGAIGGGFQRQDNKRPRAFVGAELRGLLKAREFKAPRHVVGTSWCRGQYTLYRGLVYIKCVA